MSSAANNHDATESGVPTEASTEHDEQSSKEEVQQDETSGIAKKRHYGFHKLETAKEACLRMSHHHLDKFSVPGLSSTDFIDKNFAIVSSSDKNENDDPYVLIDCRTRPERQVSMIRGAIPFEGLDIMSLPRDKTIITYCSVGYRSGLEAEYIHDVLLHAATTDAPSSGREGGQQEPQQSPPKVLVYNLDGILAYTHALSATATNQTSDATSDPPPPLVDPATQEVTKKVHTFSKQWDCAAPEYQGKQFGHVEAMMRMGQVASHAAVRKTQHAVAARGNATNATTCQE